MAVVASANGMREVARPSPSLVVIIICEEYKLKDWNEKYQVMRSTTSAVTAWSDARTMFVPHLSRKFHKWLLDIDISEPSMLWMLWMATPTALNMAISVIQFAMAKNRVMF